MRTIEYLSDPAVRGLVLPGIAAALLTAMMCGPLSVLVVVRRAAFMGQGISHAAFAGVGIGLLTLGAGAAGSLWFNGVVLGVAMAAAGLIALIAWRGRAEMDVAIGVVLAVFMAGGFELHRWAVQRASASGGAGRVPSLESVLFGGVFNSGVGAVWTAGAAAGLVLGALWLFRRPLAFWAFDETVCPVHGVSAGRMGMLTTGLIALATIVAVDVAGVALATAMLVLPGAAALRVWPRLGGVVGIAAVVSALATAAGLVLSFELGTLPGPSVVAVLGAAYLGAVALGRAA